MKQALALICIGMCATVAFAQGVTSGALSGVVLDPNGDPIPGASVVAELLTTGTRYETVTDASGRFKLVNTRAGGPYQVTVSREGLRTQEVGNLFVTLGETTNITVSMSLEGCRPSVEGSRTSPGPTR